MRPQEKVKVRVDPHRALNQSLGGGRQQHDDEGADFSAAQGGVMMAAAHLYTKVSALMVSGEINEQMKS
ncbi:hypothetical protein NQZ68_007756 [Dissostichus eleginoides]|nr:hypothetical protein NQZ68_007756 [Dissostichus eleginoides]